MSDRQAAALARLLLTTGLVDGAYRRFDAARTAWVLARLGDDVLDRFNDYAYGRSAAYLPGSEAFRAWLFPWEEAVLAETFPAAPARVLVGAAGGGREVMALVGRGYEVVAFEPSPTLVRTLSTWATGVPAVAVFRARYEDLPVLAPADVGGASARLDDLGPFDAALFGWSSFSHLRRDADRLNALRTFRAVTEGPVLVSYFPREPGPGAATRLGRALARLPGGKAREPGDAFGIAVGFYHGFTREELADLAGRAGMAVLRHVHDDRDPTWPHAVLAASPTSR